MIRNGRRRKRPEKILWQNLAAHPFGPSNPLIQPLLESITIAKCTVLVVAKTELQIMIKDKKVVCLHCTYTMHQLMCALSCLEGRWFELQPCA